MSEAILSKEVSLGRLAVAQAAKNAGESVSGGGGALAQVEQHRNWQLLALLPLKIDAAVPMPHFKVRDLLALHTGLSISSLWKVSEDVPLKIGDVEFGWGEFEVVEQRMAVRLTRLG